MLYDTIIRQNPVSECFYLGEYLRKQLDIRIQQAGILSINKRRSPFSFRVLVSDADSLMLMLMLTLILEIQKKYKNIYVHK
jgi:hypothetical protein